MAFIEYVLVALIGSSGATGLPTSTPGITLGPESIVQPNGGALLAEPVQTKKDAGKLTLNYTRYKKHRGHRRGKHQASTKNGR